MRFIQLIVVSIALTPLAIAFSMGGFRYAIINNHLVWSYGICVPWYDDYVDLCTDPPRIKRRFRVYRHVPLTFWFRVVDQPPFM